MFIPDFLFKDFCIVNIPGRYRQHLSLKEGQIYLLSSIINMSLSRAKPDRLLPVIKDSGFLSTAAVGSTMCTGITWPSSRHPAGTGAQGTGTDADNLFTTKNNKLSFCLLPGNFMSFASIYESPLAYLVSLQFQ